MKEAAEVFEAILRLTWGKGPAKFRHLGEMDLQLHLLGPMSDYLWHSYDRR